MRLVFIYGPPGVGKLTVARALARITGYKVYHNHLAIESVLPIFDFGTKEFNELVDKYRLDMIRTAARSSLPGMIMTLGYVAGVDDKYLEIINGYLSKYNGEMFAVRLFCSRDELYRRIKGKSRREYSKIRSSEKLKTLMSRCDFSGTVHICRNISINNTKKAPMQVARIIKKKYKL